MSTDPQQPAEKPKLQSPAERAAARKAQQAAHSTAAPSGNKKLQLTSALITGALLAGGLSTYAFSAKAEETKNNMMKTVRSALSSNQLSDIEIKETSYQRGMTSSTQTLLVRFNSSSIDEELPNTELIVTNKIQHGPVLLGHGVGQAWIDTQIKFKNPELQKNWETTFNKVPPTINTLVDLGGNITTDVTLPSGQIDQAPEQYRWQALKAKINVTGERITSKVSWPELTGRVRATGEISNAQFSLKGLEFSSDVAKPKIGAPFGPQTAKMTLKEAKMTGFGEENDFGLNNYTLTSDFGLKSGWYDMETRQYAGAFRTGNLRLTELSSKLGLRHIAQEPMNKLIQLSEESSNAAASAERGTRSEEEARTQRLIDQQLNLAKYVTEIMIEEPVVSLDELKFNTENGEVKLSGALTTQGLKELQANMGPDVGVAPQSIIEALAGKAQIQASRSAVDDIALALAPEMGVDTEGMITQLMDTELIESDGETLKTNIEFSHGTLKVNGQELN